MIAQEIFINEALKSSSILQAIKQLDSIEEILEFLDKNQVPIEGRGSSRTAYALDDDLVLKVAHNKSGISQNQSERRPEVSGRYGHFLARIYEADHGGKWIVAERVQADEGAVKKFFQTLGIEARELWDLARDFYDVQSYFDEAETQKSRNHIWTDFKDTWKEELSNPLVKDILYMYMEFGVRPTDFGIGNVGVSNIDGRPLVLDWGYTQDMVIEQKEGTGNMSAADIKAVIDMIPTPEGVSSFLEKFGKELGTGSSRAAYEYAPGKVIKIAINKAGIAQNKSELKHYKDLYPYVPEMYDYHPDGHWIEVEKVEPSQSDMNIIVHTVSFVGRYEDPLGEILSKWDEFKEIEKRYKEGRANIERISQEISDLQGRKGFLIKQGSGDATLFRDSMMGAAQAQANIEQLEAKEEEVHLFIDEIENSIHPDILHILRNLDRVNLDKEGLASFLDFARKVKEKGITDLSRANVGFSKERGVPVLLDYGYEYSSVDSIYKDKTSDDFDMNTYHDSIRGSSPRRADTGRTERVTSGIGRHTSNPNFKQKDYWDSTSEPNPRMRAESFFIQEQKVPRETYIANSTVEEIKRIIEMIPTPEGVIEFLGKFAKKLGKGSSRYAFDIAPGKVLKIAFNRAGLMQNEIEIRVADELGEYAAAIYDHHPEDYWIEMEKADPLGDNEGWAIADTLSDLAYQDPNQEAINNVEKEPEKYQELRSAYQELRLRSRNVVLSDEERERLDKLSELGEEFSIISIIEDYGLSFEMTKHLAGMARVLADQGISDAGPDNLGISRKTGMPIILDFGFDQADLNWMYSGYQGHGDTSPEFNPEDYFQSTNDMRPAR